MLKSRFYDPNYKQCNWVKPAPTKRDPSYVYCCVLNDKHTGNHQTWGEMNLGYSTEDGWILEEEQ